MLSLISLAIALPALLQMPAGSAGLIWQGQPVHPGCIAQLTTQLADHLPVVAAVDLEGCRRSNRYSAAPEVEGTVLRWRDPDAEPKGWGQSRR